MNKHSLLVTACVLGCSALFTQCVGSSTSNTQIPTQEEIQALQQRIYYNISGVAEKLESVKDRTSADVAAAYLLRTKDQVLRDKRLAQSPRMEPYIKQVILSEESAERYSRLQVRIEKARRRIKANKYYGSSFLKRVM